MLGTHKKIKHTYTHTYTNNALFKANNNYHGLMHPNSQTPIWIKIYKVDLTLIPILRPSFVLIWMYSKHIACANLH